MFTQCTHAIAQTGVPTTSLLGLGPSNFLLHHLAPVLYVPGAVAWVGVPAPFALVLVHAACFGAALWGLYRFCTTIGLAREVATLWTLVVSLTPCIRPEMLWGVHDEVLALPLLAWAFVMFAREQFVRSLVLASACIIAKESFAVIGVAWLALTWAVNRPKGSRFALPAGIALVPAAIGAFYVVGQPPWAGKRFDHLDRVGSMFPTWEAALDKLLFLVGFFVAFVGLPLRSARARLLCIPALPFIALGLVASDPELYRFSGYHSTVPQSLLAFAAAVGLADKPLHRRAASVVWAAVLSLQLTWKSHGLGKPAREAVTQSWYPAHELEVIPRDQLVAVDPAAALALLDHPRTIRLYAASERSAHVDWVVARPEGWEAPSPELVAGLHEGVVLSKWVAFRR